MVNKKSKNKTTDKQLLNALTKAYIARARLFHNGVKASKIDGQVREWFNLTSILYDLKEKNRFLKRIFHIVNNPT